MAYGATEPEAGSDLAALKTTATPVMEDGAVGRLPLNGRKQWISNGGVADVATVLALAPAGRPGSSSTATRPGFTHGKPEDKHGIRLSNTAALFLDDVAVDAIASSAASRARAWSQAQQVFGYTRLMVAAFGLGAGWAALDRAIPYSTERIQAGGPLSEKQGYTHKLIVPHAVRARGRTCHDRGDRRAHRRRRGSTQHRGRDRQVPRDRGRQRRRRRRHPGTRRLRLHARVHGREDQARRAHHHDLRGHLGDHGDDDRARPLAAAPQDPRRSLPRRPRASSRRCTRHPRHRRRRRGARAPRARRGAGGVPRRAAHPPPARAAAPRAAGRRSPRARARSPAGPPGGARRARPRRPTAASTPRLLAAMSRVVRPRGRADGGHGGLRWVAGASEGGAADAARRPPRPARHPGGADRPASPTWTRSPTASTGAPDGPLRTIAGSSRRARSPITSPRSSASARSCPTRPTPAPSGTTFAAAATRSATSTPAAGIPALYYDPDPHAPGQDLLEDRRLGARLRLGSAGVEAADARRRSATRWTTRRSGRSPARGWRCSTTAGPSGRSTSSAPR